MGTGVFIKGRGEAARLRGRLFSSRLTSRLRFARRQDSLGAAEECRKNRYIQAASLVTSSKRTRVISRECRSGTTVGTIEGGSTRDRIALKRHQRNDLVGFELFFRSQTLYPTELRARSETLHGQQFTASSSSISTSSFGSF